jgi:hypothetical protein
MEFKDSPYFHVAHARDLSGKDRIIYRLLEILPGFLSWSTLILIVVFSVFKPVWVAVFIIFFDLYWLLKTGHLSLHHYYNWRRLKHNITINWYEKISKLKHEHIRHMVVLPYYKEGEEVLDETFKSLVNAKYNKENIMIVLAAEERAGQEARAIAEKMKNKYSSEFGEFIITIHPEGVPGEIKGKGPNISYACEEARKILLDPQNIKYEDVLVSAFDIDTVIWPHYFGCLTWHFLTVEDPLNKSYQPVPLYNNNIWQTPAISRVAATTSTFWQMIQQERPEKLATFSSHSLVFKSLYEVGYWQKNMISDDSRIFWNLYLAKDGNYEVVPLSYPVSMDANLAPKLSVTLKNIYRQHMRWMWGVENIPYMMFGFIKNKKISWKEKLSKTNTQLTGFWSLSTNPIMILILGWLPIIVGGNAFRDTLLSYNLPVVTRVLMTIATSGLILAAIISASLLPPMPVDYKKRKVRWVAQTLQWVFVPFTIIIFGSLPGLHSQTRLMFGKYLGEFWVTPKHRKEK